MACGSFSGASDADVSSSRSDVSASLNAVSTASRLITTRLLYAGHPLHACDPPVPLHRPSPLHEPWSFFVMAAVVGGRFKCTGRWLLFDRRYNPHALQINVPSGARRQSGVLVVPQFEHCCPSSTVPPSSACPVCSRFAWVVAGCLGNVGLAIYVFMRLFRAAVWILLSSCVQVLSRFACPSLLQSHVLSCRCLLHSSLFSFRFSFRIASRRFSSLFRREAGFVLGSVVEYPLCGNITSVYIGFYRLITDFLICLFLLSYGTR